jgi:hypothetical protein
MGNGREIAMNPTSSRNPLIALLRDAFWSGTIAGVAMIPFAAVFRIHGLRINEYGRKTLELLVGVVPSPLHDLLTLIQHLIISWIVAVPLILAFRRVAEQHTRVLVGALYGAGFYVAVNSLALPFVFGDPTPWTLGWRTVYPSLVVHLVYGIVIGLAARQPVVTSA